MRDETRAGWFIELEHGLDQTPTDIAYLIDTVLMNRAQDYGWRVVKVEPIVHDPHAHKFVKEVQAALAPGRGDGLTPAHYDGVSIREVLEDVLYAMRRYEDRHAGKHPRRR